MPTMYEIYEQHADRYDALVSAEDCDGNLTGFLHDLVIWSGARVLEAGVGTGRVTAGYIDRVRSVVACDRSEHMLEFARRRLADHGNVVEFTCADNFALPKLEQAVDVFIEGWSFGHAIVDNQHEIATTSTRLLEQATRNLGPGGVVILLETLGTNSDEPGAPHQALDAWYHALTSEHRFDHRQIRTDYQFASLQEATDLMGFFFGPQMEAAVAERGATRIPEWTGVWWRRV